MSDAHYGAILEAEFIEVGRHATAMATTKARYEADEDLKRIYATFCGDCRTKMAYSDYHRKLVCRCGGGGGSRHSPTTRPFTYHAQGVNMNKIAMVVAALAAMLAASPILNDTVVRHGSVSTLQPEGYDPVNITSMSDTIGYWLDWKGATETEGGWVDHYDTTWVMRKR